VNIGSGSDTTRCQQIDNVVEFDVAPIGITYDTANAKITSNDVDELDSARVENDSSVEQDGLHLNRETTVSNTHGWEDTYGVKVTVSGAAALDQPEIGPPVRQ
jgi:hypothetical protein